ncbi:glycosyl hydrolase family 71-domain-containing protein [Mycena olivaceomarginata]|nr:glycosyl hydrolase family 71-domain-containing protein [Mycena olivaceomarginata]
MLIKFATVLACALLAAATPGPMAASMEKRQSFPRMFCHFMIGIESDRTSSADYDADMIRAKSYGIDAFALNILITHYSVLFISYDFNVRWWNTGQGAQIGSHLAQYAALPAQLFITNAVRPNNGNNKAPSGGANISVAAGDSSYQAALAGKPYLAPASAWFSTHYGPEVSYSKNWVFPSDLLWYNRWNDLLKLGPNFIEINDYGESHYVGPLSSKHQDDGGSKWAWLDMAKPFIAAYKAGATCDATDTTANTPANNASGNYFEGTMQDAIFVVTLLQSAGQLTVTSGGHTQVFNAPPARRLSRCRCLWDSRASRFARNNVNLRSLYNFNAYTGSVPAGFVDQMGPDGLASLVAGLHVQTCQPSPSLPTSAPPYTGPGGTATAPPTSTSSTTVITPPPTSSSSSTITSVPTSSPTTTVSTTTIDGSCTITASEQIRPTNCMAKGCVWADFCG